MKNTKKIAFQVFFVALALCSACQDTSEKHYIFLGHPYDWHDGARVDPRLERLDYSRFDQIWLGGDVCSRTTEQPQTLVYLDSIFDLNAPGTHWALGNHDVMFGHPERLSEATGRPSFYSAWADGMVLLVLNTNLFWPYPSKPAQENCEEKKAQLALIQQITDTISRASHLVILHHYALFTELKTEKDADAFNLNPQFLQATCDSASWVTPWLYPRLKSVQSRGVQVVMIGGDFGMRAKTYAYQTPEGILLLGSGINNSVDRRYAPEYVTTFDPDKVLILHHHPKQRNLSWSFADLDSLVAR
ncbi:MAG: metallophosphoesterase [Saprospiraceae bacterium]|nr:metallophosphoesterase [Saprospiraceae bacterium]